MCPLPKRLTLHPCLLIFLSSFTVASAAEINFNRDVQPILSDKCYYCHGPDVENNKAGLRLDLRESAIESGAITPGNLSASTLVERIRSKDPDDIMPPPEAHKPLSEDEITTLEQWIQDGAEYDIHWSYKRVEAPALSSIDAIVREGLSIHELTLSEAAKPEILLRRLYLDLIGLPPTPAQATVYLTDESGDAYEQVIEALLAVSYTHLTLPTIA